MSSTLIGQKAPEFTLPKSDGENFSLSELDGQWKVIFFYARDGSPTCKRGCLSFKEQHDLFQSLTPPVQIIGISQDSAKDHDEFKKKLDLPFTLLAPLFAASIIPGPPPVITPRPSFTISSEISIVFL